MAGKKSTKVTLTAESIHCPKTDTAKGGEIGFSIPLSELTAFLGWEPRSVFIKQGYIVGYVPTAKAPKANAIQLG